ncbi:FAD/NAD(P)-binding protein [Pseudomonas sp. Marseille-Q1929]|uniref:FAD/NAD(P)-binding protein n=1 Tax=Pseudomonas sp. Marseille-Q1929 TaxID=2730402 RepID=UPI001A8CD21E|nr:FAD/NAD(P)-binding protein [Pseudomonas sp. Marseille-Q1929]MBO0494932.1 FAD/NAD(P)-binding protein [Pseudomonas sp. Marseille-Q1929]
MPNNIITVVGGGASSVAFIYSLLEGLSRSGCHSGFSLYLIDRQSQCGRGLAYSEDCITNLLNTRAEFISPFADQPGHFYRWLSDNRGVWEDDFPCVELSPQAFLPRPLFGLYLAHMIQCLVNKAVALGCQLIQVHDEAVSLSFAHDGKVVVLTKENLSFSSDHVVLSCGNARSLEYQHLATSEGFFNSPYPLRRTCRLIPKQASVAVVGSRLSAIDTLIGLAASGHVGPITCHSRTGALPYVRGTQARYKPRILTPEMVKSCISKYGAVRLEDVMRWTLQELALGGEAIGGIDWSSKCTQKPAIEFLTDEIAQAQHPRFWQSVLYSTNAVLDLIWPAMPEEDRRKFLSYSSWWMAYRVSIPVENAMKIKDLLETEQLSIFKGELKAVEWDGRFTLVIDDCSGIRRCEYDAVVIATGTPRDVRKFDNPLVQNMLHQGLASVDPFGGVRVATETGGLINQRGYVDDRITVLGELTSGAFFFTSALEINARHSASRAENVLSKLSLVNDRRS